MTGVLIGVGWTVLTLCCLASLVIGIGAGVVGTIALGWCLLREGGRAVIRMVAG